MTRLPQWAYRPEYVSGNVVATNRGWVVEETGELLVSVAGLASALFKLGAMINTYELVLEDGVKPEEIAKTIEPELAPQVKEEAQTDDEPADSEEDEDEEDSNDSDDELTDDVEPKKEPAKKRGRPKKNK